MYNFGGFNAKKNEAKFSLFGSLLSIVGMSLPSFELEGQEIGPLS